MSARIDAPVVLRGARRNLLILFFAQAAAYVNASLLIYLLSLIAVDMNTSLSQATIPYGVFTAAVAMGIAPANRLMRKHGRRRCYLAGTLLGAAAAAMAGSAISLGAFGLLNVAMVLFGLAASFAHSYRFAAAENASPNQVGRAISIVLLGGVIGGFSGPYLGHIAHNYLHVPFAGSMLVLLFINMAAMVILLFLVDNVQDQEAQPGLALTSLVKGKDFKKLLAAALCGGGAYLAMSVVMGATPLSMRIHAEHSLAATSYVIQSHVVAMFLPSLITGRLIDRYGPRLVVGAGVGAFLASALIAIAGTKVGHFLPALILLGVGWNFVFIGSTYIVARLSTSANRFPNQAFNDVIVFTLQAMGALLAGSLLVFLGWTGLNQSMLLILFMFGGLAWYATTARKLGAA